MGLLDLGWVPGVTLPLVAVGVAASYLVAFTVAPTAIRKLRGAGTSLRTTVSSQGLHGTP